MGQRLSSARIEWRDVGLIVGMIGVALIGVDEV